MNTSQDEHLDDPVGPLAAPAALGDSTWQCHFADEVRAFTTAGSDACGNRNREQELLALGGIRRIYWLALGAGETDTATEIAEWWQQCHPLHQLDELIR